MPCTPRGSNARAQRYRSSVATKKRVGVWRRACSNGARGALSHAPIWESSGAAWYFEPALAPTDRVLSLWPTFMPRGSSRLRFPLPRLGRIGSNSARKQRHTACATRPTRARADAHLLRSAECLYFCADRPRKRWRNCDRATRTHIRVCTSPHRPGALRCP